MMATPAPCASTRDSMTTPATSDDRLIIQLADMLGQQLDSPAKLERALYVAMKAAYRRHSVQLSPEGSRPRPASVQPPQQPHTSAVANQTDDRCLAIGSLDAVEEQVNPQTTSSALQPARKEQAYPPSQLLSPDVARARYRRRLRPVIVADDAASEFSDFLTLSDWKPEWSPTPASKMSKKLAHLSKKRTKPTKGTSLAALPTPPASDEPQAPSSPTVEEPVVQRSPPAKGQYALPQLLHFKPPGASQEDIYAQCRKRSRSVSSSSSSSSSDDEDDTFRSTAPTSSANSSNPTQQIIETDERRLRRAKKARKLGLPAPPPTPPPLPAPTAFPTNKGHTIPGRDSKPASRKAQDFLGNSGKLGQDKPPHIRKAMRLSISTTPIVDELWYPSQPIRYDQKDAIITSIVRNICKRADQAQKTRKTWRSLFELVPPNCAPSKIKRKRHLHDFSTSSKTSGLRARLASAFGIVPFESDMVRKQLQKVLEPLAIANRGAFGQLDGCGFWKSWEGWECR